MKLLAGHKPHRGSHNKLQFRVARAGDFPATVAFFYMAPRQAPALIVKDYAEKAAAYQRLAAQAKDFSIKSNYLDQAQRCREFANSSGFGAAFYQAGGL